MPSLRELQSAFGAALLARGDETGSRESEASPRGGDARSHEGAIEPHIVANGIEPAARLRIYRNNSREAFVATLRTAFPVLERLVGEAYFRQLALAYRAQHPSPSGNLHHVGERLAAFLAERYAAGEYAYFTDVARLEWALQEVLVAADHPSLDLARLQSVSAQDYAGLVFELHPATRLVSSMYPVVTIWSANQPGADSQQTIDLASGPEHVLLLHTRDDVELRRLDPAEFAFLERIASGATLSGAIEATSAMQVPGTAGGFDAGASLRRNVAAGALVDFHVLTGASTA